MSSTWSIHVRKQLVVVEYEKESHLIDVNIEETIHQFDFTIASMINFCQTTGKIMSNLTHCFEAVKKELTPIVLKPSVHMYMCQCTDAVLVP